jgi:hypothetical protein
MAQALPDNPHTKFYNGELRGYLRCTVTPDLWTTDYRSVTARTSDEPVFTPSPSSPRPAAGRPARRRRWCRWGAGAGARR